MVMSAGRLRKLVTTMTQLTVCVLILGLSILIVKLLIDSKNEVEKRDTGASVLLVEVMTAQKTMVSRVWEGFGTARAMDTSDVRAEVAGLVDKVLLDRRAGNIVKKGEALIAVDATDFQHELEISKQAITGLQAQLRSLDIEKKRLQEQLVLVDEEVKLTQQEYERALESMAQGAGNQLEVDRRRTDLTRVERSRLQIMEQIDTFEPRRDELNTRVSTEDQRLQLIQKNIDRCIINAPLSGVLQSLDIKVGERVSVGMEVARIVSYERIEVPIQFPISARYFLVDGDKVELRSQGAVDQCWTAEVKRFAPEGQQGNRTIVAYAELHQPAYSNEVFQDMDMAMLVPGQFIRATASTSKESARFIVPRRAVLDDCVFVMEAGSAQSRPVVVDYYIKGEFRSLTADDTEWAVLTETSSINEGDQIIISNIQDMKSGKLVRAAGIGAG